MELVFQSIGDFRDITNSYRILGFEKYLGHKITWKNYQKRQKA